MKTLRRLISKLLRLGRFFHALEGAVCGILLIIGLLLLLSGNSAGLFLLTLAIGGTFVFISYEYVELRLCLERAGETFANMCEFFIGMLGVLLAFLISLIIVFVLEI